MFMSLLQLLVPAQITIWLYLFWFREMWLDMSLILAPLIEFMIVLSSLCWSISLIKESPISRAGFRVKNSHVRFESLAFSDASCVNRFAFSFRNSMHSNYFFVLDTEVGISCCDCIDRPRECTESVNDVFDLVWDKPARRARPYSDLGVFFNADAIGVKPGHCIIFSCRPLRLVF